MLKQDTTPTDNTKSVKISGHLWNKLVELAKKDNRFRNYHLNKAIELYLKRKGIKL